MTSTNDDAMDLQVASPRGRDTLHVTPRQQAQRLTELLRHAGLPLNTRCGERGICDGCVIELIRGALIHLDTGERVVAQDRPLPIRACAHRLGGPAGEAVKLRLPERALTAYQPQVLTEFRVNVPFAHQPLWRPDAPGDPPRPGHGAPIGVAIDVGTTTIVLLLVDLDTGRVLAHAAGFNRQMHFGDDVLARINRCLTDRTMIGRLRAALVRDTLAPLLAEALRDAGARCDQIVCVAAAGNTTMLHLLTGVDPSPMGVVPFTPAFLDHRRLTLAETGFAWDAGTPGAADAHAEADIPLHLLPGAAAYVGADLTAGAVASGLCYDPGPSLLLDVGTNGEIILKHGEQLLGCATAAGPAFEGAGLTDGIRASHGAIAHIRLDETTLEPHTQVIGEARPIGICGSAYIDFLAWGARTGLLSPSGRFIVDRLPKAAARRLERADHGAGYTYRIARAAGSKPICISEADIARLLQAKAAIAAGLLTLLHRAGLAPGEVRTLYLAGGFGMHLHLDSAIACGLLPGFQRSQVTLLGNSALAGAYLALLDRNLLQEMAAVGRGMEVLELNLDPGFEDRYIDQLTLPAAGERGFGANGTIFS